jgi:hypothetical protein
MNEQIRWRYLHDAKTGRLVVTIGSVLKDVPNTANVWVEVAVAVCAPSDHPSKARGREIVMGRFKMGKTRLMKLRDLKEEISCRTILDWFLVRPTDHINLKPNP